MAGVTLKYEIDDAEVKALLTQLGERARDLSSPMKLIGEQVLFSVQQNFAEGGRPDRWIPSKRAIVQGGQTLVNTGRLLQSLTYRSSSDQAEVGTNVIYAAIHQFGGIIPGGPIVPRRAKSLRWIGPDGKPRFAKKVQRPDIAMPARPFLMVQEEDKSELVRIIKDYLMNL